MAATIITVTHKFLNPDGTPVSGMIGFRLSQRITNGGVTYAEQVPVHSSLSATGELSQALPANNDPATTPVNSTYIVTFYLNGGQLSGDEVSITVPYNAAGGTVTLGSLLPQQEGA
jgi:hypothetical protein